MIDPRSPFEADRAEFARLLDIYGAERRRWPADRQALFDACASDMTHTDLMREAAALDDALAMATGVKAHDALKERLLVSFAPPSRRNAPARRRWLKLAPAGALAALSAMGFVVGSATAGAAADALYYAEAAMEPALSTGTGLFGEVP